MVKGITDILNSDETIQDLIGNQKNSTTKYKIFPNFCPTPEAHPYIVVRQSGKTNGGKGCASQDYSYDVVCYHSNYDEAEDISKAVEQVLTGYQDNSPSNLVRFDYIQYENAVDQFVQQPVQLHAKVLSFTATATELLPT
jgi:hypothetical protein